MLDFVLPLFVMFFGVSSYFSFSFLLFVGISIFFMKIIINIQDLEKGERRFLFNLGLYSFSVKLALIIFLYIGFLLLKGDGFAFFDDRNYHYWAEQLSSSWKTGGNLSMWTPPRGNPGYIYLCAFIYYIFEPNTLIARVFNSSISTIVIFYVYQITKKLFDAKIAKISSLLIAFFPPFVLWSSVQFKDVIVAFLITYIIFHTLNMQQNLKLDSILKYIISLILLLTIRKQYFLIILGGSLFYLVISQKLSFRKFVTGLIIVIIIISTGFITKKLGYGFLGSRLISEGHFNIVEIRQNYLISVEKTKGPIQDSLIYWILKQNIFKKIYFIPVALIFTILNPFPPWRIKSLSSPTTLFTNISVIANWLWIFYLLPSFIYGIYYSVKNNFRRNFLLVYTSLVILIAISLKYGGAFQRQRIALAPIFMIFSSIGVMSFQKWKKGYIFYMFMLGTSFVLYLILKMGW